MNWRIALFFSVPLQITGASGFSSAKASDITFSPFLGSMGMNVAPSSAKSFASLQPNMTATFGPWRSVSRTPTLHPISTRALARFTVTVVLPTPPLPDIIMILRPILSSRSRIRWSCAAYSSVLSAIVT